MHSSQIRHSIMLASIAGADIRLLRLSDHKVRDAVASFRKVTRIETITKRM